MYGNLIPIITLPRQSCRSALIVGITVRSVAGYGQLLSENSQAEQNGTNIEDSCGSRQQRTERAVMKFYRAIHMN